MTDRKHTGRDEHISESSRYSTSRQSRRGSRYRDKLSPEAAAQLKKQEKEKAEEDKNRAKAQAAELKKQSKEASEERKRQEKERQLRRQEAAQGRRQADERSQQRLTDRENRRRQRREELARQAWEESRQRRQQELLEEAQEAEENELPEPGWESEEIVAEAAAVETDEAEEAMPAGDEQELVEEEPEEDEYLDEEDESDVDEYLDEEDESDVGEYLDEEGSDADDDLEVELDVDQELDEEDEPEEDEYLDEEDESEEDEYLDEEEKEEDLDSKKEPCGETHENEEKTAGEEKAEEIAEKKISLGARLAALARKWLTRRNLAIAGGCILAVAGISAYSVRAVYFSRHFYPGTVVFGQDCSEKTIEEVRASLDELAAGYQLTVSAREAEDEVITASQIDFRYEDDQGLEQTMKNQLCVLWPIMQLVRGEQKVVIRTGCDEEKLEAAVSGLSAMQKDNMRTPKDAYLAADDSLFKVFPEDPGTALESESVISAIRLAVKKDQTQVDLEEADCYLKPEIFEDDEELNAEKEARNAVVGAHITYDFGDRQEVLDAESIFEKLVTTTTNGKYVLDPDKVRSYVFELAEKYDTFGKVHTFTTSFGSTVELYDGDYGWQIAGEETYDQLLQDLKEKKEEVIEPVYSYRGVCRDTDDIGGTYVEISIEAQNMWCYQNGELMVDTPVVTGNPNKNNETPAGGVWAIDAKMTDYVLVGEDYRSPVDYWMPFNGNIGIHDMQTRGVFGGQIYLYAGSHGCVNTPLDAVREIYNIVSIGTPVIVY
ncbi:MAG: L,D-transpeptidase family protein [Lachnospiraceae bacterium]|nr:L,D-transpeptidase family protein [Lachnospiraceae bacterium]